MKRFDSRLSRMLRYEQQLERDAEWTYRRAQLEVDRAERQTAEILESMQTVLSGMTPHESVGLTLSIRDAGQRHYNALERALVEARKQQKQAQATADSAMNALNEAMRRKRSLEILIERERKTYQKQLGRYRQQALDEIALRKWTEANVQE